MTSHSKILVSISPHEMPGMSLEVCICLSCRVRRPEVAGLAILCGVWCVRLLWVEGGLRRGVRGSRGGRVEGGGRRVGHVTRVEKLLRLVGWRVVGF